MNARGKWSTRAAIVARWFGVEENAALRAAAKRGIAPALPLRGGQVILLTGPSGAGKSTLLKSLRCKYNRCATWLDLQHVGLPRGALVIDVMAEAQQGTGIGSFSGVPKGPLTNSRTSRDNDEPAIVAALEALSRVGLGEVWSYLRTPAQLSEGQRWRLRLALALAHTRPAPDRRLCVLAADEFAAPLDRVTALVVARALRKAVSARPDLCAIVATTRDDLTAALDPDLIVQCDFGIFNVHERGSSWKDQQTNSPGTKSTSSMTSSKPKTSIRSCANGKSQ